MSILPFIKKVFVKRFLSVYICSNERYVVGVTFLFLIYFYFTSQTNISLLNHRTVMDIALLSSENQNPWHKHYG